MSRALLPVFTIVLLLMAAPASAIPICPSATMADYIGFGSAGCQFNSPTFSNFSWSEFNLVHKGIFTPPVPSLPSGVSVQPLNKPASLG